MFTLLLCSLKPQLIPGKSGGPALCTGFHGKERSSSHELRPSYFVGPGDNFCHHFRFVAKIPRKKSINYKTTATKKPEIFYEH